jgi:beta-lactamase regulating signal transducer with metallopeptidase domain
MMGHIIEFYKLANLTLVMSLLVYMAARLLAKLGRGRVLSRNLLRTAQVCSFFSLALPSVILLAPAKFDIPNFWPKRVVEDYDSMTLRATDLSLVRALKEKSVKITHTETMNSQSIIGENSIWMILLTVGFLLGLARAGLGLHKLRNSLSGCTPFRKIGRMNLLISSDNVVPFATRGFFNLYIVVPCHILGSLNYLKMAIKHEIQHHRQGDTIWMFFVEFLKVLFFFNPAVYLWAREIAESQELACDEALITKRRVPAYEYGGCLIYVAESTLPKRFDLFGTAGMSCGSSEPKSLLRRRIQMLGSHKRTGSRAKLGLLVLTISVGLMGAVAFASSITDTVGTDRLGGAAATYAAIQHIAEAALVQGVANANADSGFAVITDVGTGQILAAAHVNRSGGKVLADPSRDFLRQAFGPMSVAKPIVVAEAVDKGGVKPQDIVDCGDGSLDMEGTTYKDWKAFGEISVTKIIANSSNIGTIKIADSFGGAKVDALLPDFGFGPGSMATNYPNAGSGTIPSAGSMPEDLLGATIAVGAESFTVTPLEMVEAYAAIANGGKLFAPQPYSPNGKSVFVRQVISDDTSRVMRSMLRAVVTEGTGSKAATDSYSTAGKTGSSPQLSGKNGITAIASFAGFAPVTKPRVAVYVGIENPPDANGGSMAAPVFSRIVEPSLHELGVTPDL